MRKFNLTKIPAMNIPFVIMILLVFGFASNVYGQATSITSMGYRANEGGGGSLSTEYTTGNLGNTWAEGEWVPYQLVISNVQNDYENLNGFPDIVMSYDFTKSGARFVDLVRDIQFGYTILTDAQGWPKDDGSAYPVTTRPEIELAQNDIGNAAPLENVWSGFTLLSLPESQINRDTAGAIGTELDAERTFRITKADLIAAGVDTTANTIVIYYQLHESRSFIWFNTLQKYYSDDFTPGTETDAWGGYLYADPPFSTDSRNGAGYVPGSSGHIEVEFGGGAKTVPIPIPEQLPGLVSGLKWLDQDGDGTQGISEPSLSGWRVYVSGELEGIPFSTSTLTDGLGNYSFPNLTSGVTWTIKEDAQREVPFEEGYMQTYPLVGSIYELGLGVLIAPPEAGIADVGWEVALTLEDPNQENLNFGNKLCEVTITCPPDTVMDCTEPTDPSSTGEATAEGNCPPINITYSDVETPGDCPEEKTITRTWVATDDIGNADTCVQIIQVEDNTAPVITCPDDQTFECDAIGDFGTATAIDDCDPDPEVVLAVRDSIPGDCAQEYQLVLTYVATDNCGNADTCQQTITVEDNTPPVISCPDDQTFECDAIGDFGVATATDNCDPSPDVDLDDRDSIPGDCAQEYQLVLTYVATDDCGNADTCQQTITVEDNTPPVISCPDDQTFECDAVGDFGIATATDNCDPSPDVDLDGRDSIPGDCAQEYQLVLTYVATDDCGNADTCQQTITVEDNTPPVITCPDDQTFECDAVGDFGIATATDNCDPEPDVDLDNRDSIPGDCAQEYQLVLTYVATDDCGNADTCQQTITVEDNTPPVISCPPDTVFECDAVGNPGTATATDNCDPVVDIDFEDDTLTTECPLEIVRTWIAVDDCGNADTCQQNIMVIDETAPVLSCPSDKTFECDAIGDFGIATATDNCDTDPDVDLDDRDSIPGDCANEYQLVLTYVATDYCGNADTCQQTITVEDNTPPVISCPDDQTFECDAVGDFGIATATDNCDPSPDVDLDGRDSIPGDCAQEYQLVLTYVATDDCGNADTCQQTITVEDNTPPVITCPDDQTFECDAVGDFGIATATDNCDPEPDVDLDNRDSIPGDCAQEYQLVLTYVATDDCGNADTCQQTITVEDNTPPVISCPPDTVFECDAVGNPGTATATDNCDPVVDIDFEDDTLTTECPLEIVRTWIAVDDCGNADTCQQNIMVIDETAPVLTCPADTTFECDAVGEFGVATATDNCDLDPDVVLDGRDSIPGDCANEYQLVLTYVATDICGNADTCQQTITVEDNTPPEIACPDSLVFDCHDIGDFGSASATDNCDPDPEVVLANRDSIPGDCPLEYELVLTWTATDECGNVDSCQQIVMVQDTIAPTLTCADQDTIECEEDLVFMTPTAEDNCDPDPSIEVVSTDTTSGPGEGEFTYTQCWVAVDTCGNISDTCCQTIIRLACPQDFCTYTMGGWGSGCPDSQADDWMSTQPGCIRDHYFDSVFTDGVIVGDMGGFYIKFTSAYAVEQFLPAGGTPNVLTATMINPDHTSAGVLAGQLLALRLNLEYSCAGVFYDIGLLEGIACYGSYIIDDSCGGEFAGMTVDGFLDLADQVVGGNVGLLAPYNATLSDLNYTATCLNELFDNCGFDDEIIPTVYGAALKAVPEQFSLSQNSPNPFNPITGINFALPTASHVKLEIFNIRGQKVVNLVNGYLDAGYHKVIWDGSGAASGIYFYRIVTDEFTASKKMLLLK